MYFLLNRRYSCHQENELLSEVAFSSFKDKGKDFTSTPLMESSLPLARALVICHMSTLL